MNKKVLVCGAGSIGKRHIENLLTLGVSVFVWRTQINLLKNIAKEYNVETYEAPFKSLEIYNTFIHLMLKNACKPCVNYIGIVINSTYKHIIQNNIPADFALYADETLGSTSAISHFNIKQSTKREMLLIFKRIIRKRDTED